MHNYSYTKSIDIDSINRLFFIISNDLRCDKTWSSAFCKDDCGLIVKCSQTIINNFETVLTIIFIQRIFFFKKNIFWLDISMHNTFFLQILYAWQNLFEYPSNLMRFHVIFLFTIGYLFVKSYSVQKFQNKVVFISVFINFKKSHQIFML